MPRHKVVEKKLAMKILATPSMGERRNKRRVWENLKKLKFTSTLDAEKVRLPRGLEVSDGCEGREATRGEEEPDGGERGPRHRPQELPGQADGNQREEAQAAAVKWIF